MLVTKIELTSEQHIQLFGIRDALLSLNDRGKLGLVIAQIDFFDNPGPGRATATIALIEDEKIGIAIVKAMGASNENIATSRQKLRERNTHCPRRKQ